MNTDVLTVMLAIDMMRRVLSVFHVLIDARDVMRIMNVLNVRISLRSKGNIVKSQTVLISAFRQILRTDPSVCSVIMDIL